MWKLKNILLKNECNNQEIHEEIKKKWKGKYEAQNFKNTAKQL